MFAKELKEYIDRRDLSVKFICKELEISQYKVYKLLDEDVPEPEKWIRIGFIKALDTIGLPDKPEVVKFHAVGRSVNGVVGWPKDGV